MLFSGRAYYNLLWLERGRGKLIPAEEWEYLDYREIETSVLFKMMHQYEIVFDTESFIEYCDELDSPEDFPETLQLNEEDKRKVYLIAFELWRRLLPKESISVFCDELDYTIASYEKDKNSNRLLFLLQKMRDILDQNVAFDEDPQVIFKRLCLYVAHDLENVIYTYINSQLGESQDPYVDLLDSFMPYVKEKRALLFLKLKSINDVFEEKDCLMEYLCGSLQESVNFSLSVAMLFFLIEKNKDELFKELFSFLVTEIKEEKLLVTLLDVLIAYHQQMGHKDMKEQVSEFLQKKLKSNRKTKLTKVQKNKVLSFL
ncbi:MAG: hypothetical protein S4CHLAM20_12720 [Chlamydiia bacterium]|nr:hypothetical protein [Chlamydiia bacterium]